MASPFPRRTEEDLWAELCALPGHLKGQIIDGELIVQPRPRPRHARVIQRLARFLSPIDDGDGLEGGKGGPVEGSWWILIEPGIKLPGAPEIVPDLGGWRRTTLPELDLDAPITTRPDWACEVLSPSNTRDVIVKKQAAFARHGVEWLWLVSPDPVVRTLQVFRLDPSGHWLLQSALSDEPSVRVPPFEDLELPLGKLWLTTAGR